MLVKFLKQVLVFSLIGVASSVVAEPSVLPTALPNGLEKEIDTLRQNPALLKVINRHNLKVINMAQIKRRDEIWKTSPKGRVLINAAMRNPASVALKKFAQSRPYLQGVTLLDRRGINIAMDKPAAAYWGGDKDTWKQPISTGKQFVSELEADENTDKYVKVSTPILSDGKTVGVLMVSLDISAI